MDTATKQTYCFTFTLAGVPEPDPGLTDPEWDDRMTDILDEVAGRVLAVGCEDSSLHSTGPTVFLSFHREAGSLAEAVGSAIADLERAGFGVARIEIEGDQP